MFFFVWVRGTVVRFRYDQFMIFGWKVLIPFALGWIFILAAFRGVQEFGNIDARPILFAIAAIAAVLLVVTLIIDQRTSARSQPERASANTNENEPPFDAFANGYPVPPLPGQTLPPSPRAARRAAQPATRTAQVESTGQEDNDDN